MAKFRNRNRLFNYNYEFDQLYIYYKYHYHFFHSLINKGYKLLAFKSFINIKYELKLYECIDPILPFFLAMKNISPQLLLFPLKQGSLINEVAMPITIRKQIIFATKWVIKLLKDRYSSLKYISLLLFSSIYNVGPAISLKKKIEKEAIRNRYLIKYFK